jgi:hypothetical protein
MTRTDPKNRPDVIVPGYDKDRPKGQTKDKKDKEDKTTTTKHNDEATTQQIKNYLGFDFDKRRRERPY